MTLINNAKFTSFRHHYVFNLIWWFSLQFLSHLNSKIYLISYVFMIEFTSTHMLPNVQCFWTKQRQVTVPNVLSMTFTMRHSDEVLIGVTQRSYFFRLFLKRCFLDVFSVFCSVFHIVCMIAPLLLFHHGIIPSPFSAKCGMGCKISIEHFPPNRITV